MFTEYRQYRKIHIVVIAKLGINIYTYRQLCWERGNIHCVRPLGRMHTILVPSAVTSRLYMYMYVECRQNILLLLGGLEDGLTLILLSTVLYKVACLFLCESGCFLTLYFEARSNMCLCTPIGIWLPARPAQPRQLPSTSGHSRLPLCHFVVTSHFTSQKLIGIWIHTPGVLGKTITI